MTTYLPKDSDTPVALVASALDPQVQQILNVFATSQIALRIPKKSLAQSNPQIGNAIANALNAVKASASAAAEAYTATTPGNWTSTPPTTVQAALDRVAAALVAAGHTP